MQHSATRSHLNFVQHYIQFQTAIMAYIHNRYLDAEERYEVYVVKAAERPHLLHWTANNNCKEQTNNNISHEHEHDEEKKVDDHDNITTTSCSAEEYPPPLTDGCDIS